MWLRRDQAQVPDQGRPRGPQQQTWVLFQMKSGGCRTLSLLTCVCMYVCQKEREQDLIILIFKKNSLEFGHNSKSMNHKKKVIEDLTEIENFHPSEGTVKKMKRQAID